MKTPKTKPILWLQLSAASCACLTLALSPAHAEETWKTIVAENYGGLATEDLNGTTADIFDAAITAGGGLGTMAYRATGDIDMWAVPGNQNEVAPDDVLFSGDRTLTITLDLRGYNGTTNFGSVSFRDSVAGTFGSHNFAAARNFNSILLSTASTTGTYSSELVQPASHREQPAQPRGHESGRDHPPQPGRIAAGRTVQRQRRLMAHHQQRHRGRGCGSRPGLGRVRSG